MLEYSLQKKNISIKNYFDIVVTELTVYDCVVYAGSFSVFPLKGNNKKCIWSMKSLAAVLIDMTYPGDIRM